MTSTLLPQRKTATWRSMSYGALNKTLCVVWSDGSMENFRDISAADWTRLRESNAKAKFVRTQLRGKVAR